MSVLKRLSNLIRSNVNDALDKAEDPKKILDQTILDMQKEHQKAKKMLLETVTLQKQAERQAKDYRKSANDWESKAMSALKGGNEDLARQALEEKQKYDELATEAEAGLSQQLAYTDELKKNLSMLEAKIEEAKKRRDELVARLNAAELKKKQAAIRGGDSPVGNAINDNSAFDTFERMTAKIENQEAELEARSEIMGSSIKEAQLEAKFAEEVGDSSADAALEALKAKMAGNEAAAATPASSAPPSEAKASAIEDELAALRKKLDDG